MLGWIAKSLFSSILGHAAVYLILCGGAFYFGVLWAQRVDVDKVEAVVHDLVELREERAEVENVYAERQRLLQEKLNAYKSADKLHRQEIDTLKRLRDRGCILKDHELQAHPYSDNLRDGFTGRVRPQNR
jgi:hypothetical protein